MALDMKQKPATAAQVLAWKKRMGFSLTTGSEHLNVHRRTFARWCTGEAESPRLLGDKFRTEGLPSRRKLV